MLTTSLRVVLSLVGALCAAALLPALAQGAPGGDATVEATAFTVGPGLTGSATAACPAGSRVVGGGVDTTGPTATGPAAPYYQILVSGPQDETGTTLATVDGDIARNWFASIFNGTDATLEFRVFALCSRDSDAVVESNAYSMESGESGASFVATCPAGTRVTGGGLGTTGPVTDGAPAHSYTLQLSAPRDETGLIANTEDGDVARSWSAWTLNASGARRTFKTFALCSATSDATIEVERLTLANDTSGATTATCPAGRRVLGGGLGTSGPVSTGDAPGYRLRLAGPQDETGLTANTQDGDVARRFHAYFYTQSGQQEFKVIALCASDPPAAPGTPGAPAGPGAGGQGGPGADAPLCLGKRATIVGTPGRDVLSGTRRADVIVALAGNDVINALGGNDLVCAGAGNDRVTGGLGADRIAAGAGNDRIAGGAGVDTLLGGAGLDTLLGGAGRDVLTGGPGRDQQTQ